VQAWFENLDMIQRMRYRAEYEHIPGETSDIFDGTHYCELRGKYVVVNGEKLFHKFFSDQRDVACGISTDGCQVSYKPSLC
jgi:hypothetical protein